MEVDYDSDTGLCFDTEHAKVVKEVYTSGIVAVHLANYFVQIGLSSVDIISKMPKPIRYHLLFATFIFRETCKIIEQAKMLPAQYVTFNNLPTLTYTPIREKSNQVDLSQQLDHRVMASFTGLKMAFSTFSNCPNHDAGLILHPVRCAQHSTTLIKSYSHRFDLRQEKNLLDKLQTTSEQFFSQVQHFSQMHARSRDSENILVPILRTAFLARINANTFPEIMILLRNFIRAAVETDFAHQINGCQMCDLGSCIWITKLLQPHHCTGEAWLEQTAHLTSIGLHGDNSSWRERTMTLNVKYEEKKKENQILNDKLTATTDLASSLQQQLSEQQQLIEEQREELEHLRSMHQQSPSYPPMPPPTFLATVDHQKVQEALESNSSMTIHEFDNMPPTPAPSQTNSTLNNTLNSTAAASPPPQQHDNNIITTAFNQTNDEYLHTPCI